MAYLAFIVPYCFFSLLSIEQKIQWQVRDAELKEGNVITAMINSTFTLPTTTFPPPHEYATSYSYQPSNEEARTGYNFPPCSPYAPEACHAWRCGENGFPCDNNTSSALAPTVAAFSGRSPENNNYRTADKKTLGCSCVGELDTFYCCQRAMIVVHKMGLTVIQGLAESIFPMISGRYVGSAQIMKDHAYGRRFEDEYRLPKAMDYRHVVVTRNWYDSIISGYLYHKSGRECWLDWYGNPGHEGWLLNNTSEHWEQRLLQDNTTMKQNSPWPPGNDRDLCQYLTEEPEEVGMRVYTAWAMSSFMIPLREFRQNRQELERRHRWNRTVFLCYDKFMTPLTAFQTVSENVIPWLFPNQKTQHHNARPPQYLEGHATNQDPMLRSRLHELIARIDEEIYGGTISDFSDEFGCVGESGPLISADLPS